ncbi:MAG TPA: hypothetical protein VF779_13160 [Pyrinomonadaceae bacterium]
MLPRKTVSYLFVVLAMLVAFSLGRAAFAQSYVCRYDTRCTHAVSYCTALYPCNNFGFTCWEEYGQCCDGMPGSSATDYCGYDCDSGGTGCSSG